MLTVVQNFHVFIKFRNACHNHPERVQVRPTVTAIKKHASIEATPLVDVYRAMTSGLAANPQNSVILICVFNQFLCEN
jgi:hypothetical protein